MMGSSFKALLPLAVLVSVVLSASAILIEVPGYATRLEGTTEVSATTERPFYAFRGVYYAEQPTNLTRFLPPTPKAPYPADEIVDAARNNVGCTQGGSSGTFGKEDCLTLDVYTPYLRGETGKLLPVMFWIHGGAFSLGQDLEYLPQRYMEKDIVLVTIQYRLGPLGFLCFDTDDVPGNAGIFDQIEALRWVNRHIQSFGGDPSHIVIAGESAGSASVSLLVLAPQTRGLFIGAIGESASVLAPWALDDGDKGRIASTRVAEIAGCPTANYAAMLDCVRNIDDNELTKAYGIYQDEDMLQGNLGFSASNPVIQKAGQQRLIEVPPQQLLDSGNYNQVPSFWGANKQEGTLVLGILYNSYLVPNDLVNDTEYMANQAVPDILKALSISDPTGEIAAAYTEEYLGYADMGDFTSMTAGMTDMLSVLFIKEATYQFAQASSKNQPTFFYSFNYNARHSLFNYIFARTKPPIPHGVCHADELIYLWAFPFDSGFQLNASEHNLSDKMIQVWTNFVTYLDPTPNGIELLPGIPKFKPYTQQEENYMAINEDWEVRLDFTKTYTVTVDELNLPAVAAQRNDFGGRFKKRHLTSP